MAKKHKCAGVQVNGDFVQICVCVSAEMYNALDAHYRQELLKEIQAFANDYHHHIDGVDVVAVEPLLAFLTPIEGKESNGLGTS